MKKETAIKPKDGKAMHVWKENGGYSFGGGIRLSRYHH